MFTLENTENFTQSELDLMNSAVEVLMSQSENEDDLKYCEARINNNFIKGVTNTIDSLIKA